MTRGVLMTTTDVRLRARQLFTTSSPSTATLAAPAPAQTFSTFDPPQARRAADLVTIFFGLLKKHPGDAGLSLVLDVAEASVGAFGAPLVKYALAVFIAHHREA